MNKYWFIFCGDNILLEKRGDSFIVPFSDNQPICIDDALHIPNIPDIDTVPSLAYSFSFMPQISNDYCFVSLRQSYSYLQKEHYYMSGLVHQLSYWESVSKYCSSCGGKLEYFGDAHGKRCLDCGCEFWPKITPAIIVLIRRFDDCGDEKILLVRAHNFKGDFHGLVAGFVEVGETLEECVIREVYEETRLRIKNIKYFGSQSWPYPSGLMIGFIADYESGDIEVQETELKYASWYTKNNLPKIPERLSIARKLIDYWLDSQGTNSL